MSRAKFEAAKRKTGGISSAANTSTLQTLSPDQIRQEAYAHRGSSTDSPAQMAIDTERRQELLTKMGYDIMHVDELAPHPENDYSIEPESIENLAASIYESGNTSALLVRTMPNGQKNQILAGERRWHAHQLLRERHGEAWAMVPVRNLGSMSDEDALFVLHSDNMGQRQKLTPTERAKGFSIIADRLTRQREADPSFRERYKGKKTRAILAEQFGVSESAVAAELAISRQLTEEGKKLLDEGELGKYQAASVARMPVEKQNLIMDHISEGEYESDEIDQIIDVVKHSEDPASSIENLTSIPVKERKQKTTNSLMKNARNALRKAINDSEEPDPELVAQLKKYVMLLDERVNQKLTL